MDGFTESYYPENTASAGDTSSESIDVSGGLEQNTDACACASLACDGEEGESTNCEDQSWSQQICGTSATAQWAENTCPEDAYTNAPTEEAEDEDSPTPDPT